MGLRYLSDLDFFFPFVNPSVPLRCMSVGMILTCYCNKKAANTNPLPPSLQEAHIVLPRHVTGRYCPH